MYRVSLNDEELLAAVEVGQFDWQGKIPTFRQFDELVRRRWAQRNHRDMIESYRTLTDYGLVRNWHRYVVSRFARGARLPRRVWWMLDQEVRQDVCDTDRGRAAKLTTASMGRDVFGAAPVPFGSDGKNEARRSGNAGAETLGKPKCLVNVANSL